MNPLDRPSIRKLVDGHRARDEDPWVLIAALYAKLDGAPKPRGCVWDEWVYDADGRARHHCPNIGSESDIRCNDDLARVLLDRNGHANLDLCDEHWTALEARLRPVATLVYERTRNARIKHRDRNAAVYFLRRGDGKIKIGFSSDVSHRVSQLEEAHGPLEVIRTEQGGRNREKQLHRQFAEHRAEGEWFRPAAPLREYLDA